MEKVGISAEQEKVIKDFKCRLKGFGESVLIEVIKGNYEVIPRFIAGDWVVHVVCDRVAQVSNNGCFANAVYVNDEEFTFFEKSQTRHATPEEIEAEKERRRWAEIGRRPGKFKKADVYIDKFGMPYTIGDANHLNSGVIRRSKAESWYEEGNFKGLYPADAFVEFGGGEEE